MKYTKENLHVGFTFGPVDTLFRVEEMLEGDKVTMKAYSPENIIDSIFVYNLYTIKHLLNLVNNNKGWDFHCKKQLAYELY